MTTTMPKYDIWQWQRHLSKSASLTMKNDTWHWQQWHWQWARCQKWYWKAVTLKKTTKSLLSCRTLLQKSLYLGVLRDPKARLDTIRNLSHWRSCSESTFEWVSARVHFDRTDSRSFLHFQAVFEQFPSALILTPFSKWDPRHGAELTRPCRPDILKWFHDAGERHLGGSLKVPITFFSDILSGPKFYWIDNILCSLF